jgi:hypothetical protein
MECAARILCDALHDSKQVLISVPSAVRKNKLATGVLPLALGNRCDKVVRNRNATNMPMLGVLVQVRLVHDV